MANFAIKGHKTRGAEIIEILKMLGGNNPHEYIADSDSFVFHIGRETRNIYYDWLRGFDDENMIIFTIEEFLEKFPYKVGDRVRIPEYESEVRISKMFWNGDEVLYEVWVADEAEWYSANELNEFNEPNEPNKEKKINQISLANCDLNEVEIVLGDKFELKIEDGKYYAIKKKLQYPKTYEECCEVLFPNSIELGKVLTSGYNCEKLKKFGEFGELLICRDAYWKIAGTQMGLGKPWEPDYTDDNVKYIIGVHRNHLDFNSTIERNYILIFPTEEMRDAFYENFKDLIEKCMRLL